jgi:hypothetical protein
MVMFSLNPTTYELVILITLGLLLILLILLILFSRLRNKNELLKENSVIEAKDKSSLQDRVKVFEEKYSDVFDREEAIDKLDKEINNKNEEINSLRSSYQQKNLRSWGFINLAFHSSIQSNTKNESVESKRIRSRWSVIKQRSIVLLNGLLRAVKLKVGL